MFTFKVCIIASNRNHRKRQSYIPLNFAIFLSSSPRHCKWQSDGWGILLIGRNSLDIDLSILFIDDCSQHLMINKQFQDKLNFYRCIPESRESFGFLFSEVQRENTGLKWVSLYSNKLLESKKLALSQHNDVFLYP